jgi:HEPN domain-containing protein
MNRVDFQSLALERVGDAEALLQKGRYGAAYYLCGYAIECGLKACIARRTKQDEFPPKDANTYYTHDLMRLLGIAGLQSQYDQEKIAEPAFEANWAIVKDWTEQSRYRTHDQQEASEILAAVKDPQAGVLQWLRKNW